MAKKIRLQLWLEPHTIQNTKKKEHELGKEQAMRETTQASLHKLHM